MQMDQALLSLKALVDQHQKLQNLTGMSSICFLVPSCTRKTKPDLTIKTLLAS